MENRKTCKICLQEKKLIDFHKDKKSITGHMNCCKSCRKSRLAGDIKELYIKDYLPHISIYKEQWIDFTILNKKYKISSFGRVLSLNIKYYNKDFKSIVDWRLMKVSDNGNGYLILNFTNYNGKTKSRYIHQLVAKHFIPTIDGKKYVNHINGIKNDNRVENLEWCTAKENSKHAIDSGLMINKGEMKYIDINTHKIIIGGKNAALYLGTTAGSLCNLLLYWGGTYNGITRLKDFIKNNPEKSKELGFIK